MGLYHFGLRAVLEQGITSLTPQRNGCGPDSQADISPSAVLLLSLQANSPSPNPVSLSLSGQEESGDSVPLSDQTLSSTELMAELGMVKGLLSSRLEKFRLTLSCGGRPVSQALSD